MTHPYLTIAPYSDLHLEYSAIDLDVGDADVVVLAGDIWAGGRATPTSRDTLIDRVARMVTDKPVVLVPGNHDFEGARIHQQMQVWKDIAQQRYGGHIHVLWNEVMEWGGVRFLGTPLFTNFASTNCPEQSKHQALNNVIDFSSIFLDNGKPVSPQDYEEWFNDACQFLQDQLASHPSSTNVVVSHFSPSLRMQKNTHSPAMTTNQALIAYWNNACDDLVARAHCWISGHVHQSQRVHLGTDPNKGHLISNARGVSKVPQVSKDPQFDRAARINVPCSPHPATSPHGASWRC